MSEHDKLTFDKLIDTISEFSEQKKKFNIVVGFTFTTGAWDQIKGKLPKPEIPIAMWTIDGIECYIVNGQKVPVIGWYNKELMDLFIKLNGNINLSEVVLDERKT